MSGLQGVSPPRQRLRGQLGFQVLHFALVGEDEKGAVVAGVCELSVLEISGEITPERMKGCSQSKKNTQLWMGLVI